MQRSRLKNIINKSKEFSKIGDPFEDFKNTLPKELQIGENYRLKAAWKAYGSPKNYKEALWEGMIQPIDENNFKLPSIGYNEETEEYEYLNKGEDNETVAKDIRVWDNDVIPLVQELKLGGYVRKFNKEKDCWTYTKNLQKENTLDQNQVNIQKEQSGELIDSFQKGGKPKRNIEQLITYANNQKPPFIQRILENDERTYTFPDGKIGTHLLNYDTYNGKTYVFPEIQQDPAGNLWWYKDRALDRALERNNVLEMTPEEAELFVKEYKKYYPNYKPFKMENGGELNYFKQGGQMSVIPEGALHAHKNHMEGAGEDFTAKGVPVVDNNGEQQAEIEREEIIYSKKATDTIEKAYKEFYQEGTSESRKEELAINIGKFLTKEILENTQDNTGLIEKVAEKNNL